jgi:MOSC domain-containing protein YiiM
MEELRIEGVFVGTPGVLGERRGAPVYSAITKHRVTEPELKLDELNLAGDRQADLTVHGGPDKAVYSYPAEHYPDWAGEDFAVPHGTFGENVSTRGADERTVRIGDVWAWGDALLEVSQPREPCYKLAMKAGRKEIVPAMIGSGRSGWYLRVRRPGTVPTTGSLRLVERDPASPTIAEVYLTSFANAAEYDGAKFAAYRELAERVIAAPALAARYRDGLRSKLLRLSRHVH